MLCVSMQSIGYHFITKHEMRNLVARTYSTNKFHLIDAKGNAFIAKIAPSLNSMDYTLRIYPDKYWIKRACFTKTFGSISLLSSQYGYNVMTLIDCLQFLCNTSIYNHGAYVERLVNEKEYYHHDHYVNSIINDTVNQNML
jgi:hypothetical protein